MKWNAYSWSGRIDSQVWESLLENMWVTIKRTWIEKSVGVLEKVEEAAVGAQAPEALCACKVVVKK